MALHQRRFHVHPRCILLLRFVSFTVAPLPLPLRVARVLWRDEEPVVQSGSMALFVVVRPRPDSGRRLQPLLVLEGEEVVLELLNELNGTTDDGRLVSLWPTAQRYHVKDLRTRGVCETWNENNKRTRWT